jgi:methylornithine synthase
MAVTDLTVKSRVERFINNAMSSGRIDPVDMAAVLSLPPEEKELAELVFATARNRTRLHFRDKVFLYGFVYLSTYCHNDCSFCNYRVSNTSMNRYRKEPFEIIDVANELIEEGVNLIDLTLGEDEEYLHGPGFEVLLRVIDSLRLNSDVSIMLSPGVLDTERLKAAKAAGADWYALYQETFNRTLFRRLRPGQDFNKRLAAKSQAREEGFLIEDGLLIGVGASPMDLVYSIMTMSKQKIQQYRAMAYVPVPGGLGVDTKVERSWQELLAIACMRVVNAEALIPASLDVDGLIGLERRLLAGANVVTSMVPPSKGFRGVASMDLDIDNSNRSPSKVKELLAGMNRIPVSTKEYRDYCHASKP